MGVSIGGARSWENIRIYAAAKWSFPCHGSAQGLSAVQETDGCEAVKSGTVRRRNGQALDFQVLNICCSVEKVQSSMGTCWAGSGRTEVSSSSVTSGREIVYVFIHLLLCSLCGLKWHTLSSANRDPSVSQAWASCHGGQTVSPTQPPSQKSFQWMFGGTMGSCWCSLLL